MLLTRPRFVLAVVLVVVAGLLAGLFPAPVAAEPGPEQARAEAARLANERAKAHAEAALAEDGKVSVEEDLVDGLLDQSEGDAIVLPPPDGERGPVEITGTGTVPEDQVDVREPGLVGPQAGRIEVGELRTERSVTFRNPDGTLTTEQHTSAVSVREGDAWVAMDQALVVDGDRLEQRKGNVDADVARFATDDLARFKPTPDTKVAFKLPGASRVTGRVEHDQVVYDQAKPGLSIELKPTPIGVKETLIVDSPRAARDLRFEFSLEGLTAEQTDSGSIRFVDADRTPRAEVPTGFAQDARGATTFGVTYVLSKDGRSLRVSVDEAWLTAPDRAWPVKVDPTITFAESTTDTYANSCAGNTNYGASSKLFIGKQIWPASCQNRAWVKFDNFNLMQVNAKVFSADLLMYNTFSNNYCIPYPVYANEPGSGWNASTLTWNNQPSINVSVAGSGSFAHACGGGAGNWGAVTGLGPLVERWWNGSSVNNGLTLSTRPHPSTTETDPLAYKEFFSTETSNGPTLSITWTPHRATYAGSSSWVTAPTLTNPGVYRLWPTNSGYLTWGTGTHKMSYRVFDSNGNQMSGMQNLRTALPSSVAAGQQVQVNANVEALPPGSYQLRFSMVYDPNGFAGDGDDIWFDTEGSLPWGVNIVVPNQAPIIESVGPAGVASYAPPALVADAYDPDNWPWYPISYKFKICQNDAMNSGCVQSNSGNPQSDGSWRPANLKWGTAYFWQVTVLESGPGARSTTSPVIRLVLTPRQPDTSQLGSGSDKNVERGVNIATGNYTRSIKDAFVANGALSPMIERTYNSADSRTNTLFGRGWSTTLDMSAVDEPVTNTILVTYGDGSQERFGRNPDGTYGRSEKSGVRIEDLAGTSPVQRLLHTQGGTRYRFAQSGELLALRAADDSSLQITYQNLGGAGNRMTEVVGTPSGRKLNLGWTSNAPYHVGAVWTENVSGAGSSQWTYEYGADNLTKVCGPRSTVECSNYTYGSSGGAADRLTKITTPGNNTGADTTFVELAYHSNGAIHSQTDGAGKTWTYADNLASKAGLYQPLGGALLYSQTHSNTNAAEITLAGAAGLPASAGDISAVVLNVQGNNATNGGWINAFPSDKADSVAGTRLVAGQVTDGMVTVAPGANGKIKIRSTATGSTILKAWVVGFYTSPAWTSGGSGYHPIRPERIIDSRPTAQIGPFSTPWSNGETRTIDVTAPALPSPQVSALPATGVTAVVVNFVSIQPTAGGYLTAYAATDPRPSVQSARSWSGLIRGNTTVVKVGTDGQIKVENTGGTNNLVIEVVGWYGDITSDPNAGVYTSHPGVGTVSGRRIFDTRANQSQIGPYSSPWPNTGSRPARLAGVGSLPTGGLVAIQGLITGVLPTGNSRLIAYEGSGSTVPVSQNLYTQPNAIQSNGFSALVDDDGIIAIANTGAAVDTLIDVHGWFTRPHRIVTVTPPSGSGVDPTEYGFNADRLLTSRKNAEGNYAYYVYDATFRLTKEVHEDRSSTFYGYTSGGLLSHKTQVDPLPCNATIPILIGFGSCIPATGQFRRQQFFYSISGGALSVVSAVAPGDWSYGKPVAVLGENALHLWGYPGLNGLIANVADRATLYTYNTYGQVTAVRSPVTADAPSGRTTATAYTTGSEPAIGGGTQPPRLAHTTTGPDGTALQYDYDSKGDLRKVTGPYPAGNPSAGLVVENTYDELGREITAKQISDTYPLGLTTTRTYDKRSALLTVTSPQVTDVVDAKTHQARTTYTYDGNGNVTTETLSDLNGWDSPRQVAYTYDAADRRKTETDPAGKVTTVNSFNAFSNPTSVTDGAVTYTFTYAAGQDVQTATLEDFVDDPIGAPSTTRDVLLEFNQYDALGRRTERTDAEGRITTYSWTNGGLPDTTILKDFHNPDGSVRGDIVLEDLDYDPAGNIVKRTTPAPGVVGATVATTYTYNDASELETETYDSGGLGRLTDYTYDLAGNMTVATKSDASRSETVQANYDHRGNILATRVDPAGLNLITTNIYDQRGLPLSSIDPSGAVTTFTHDSAGRLATTTLPVVTVERYDVSALTTTTQTATGYNTFGEQTSAKDANANITTTSRDVLGRARVIGLPAYTQPGTATVFSPTESVDYNIAGHVISTTDRSGGVTDYTNDALGRSVRTQAPAVDGSRATTRTKYGDSGSMIEVTDAIGAKAVMVYDDLDRLSKMTQVERYPSVVNQDTNFVYDDTSLVVSQMTAGTWSQRSYNRAGEMTSEGIGGAVTRTYGRDLAGREVSSTDALGRGTRTTYDQAGRPILTEQVAPGGAVLADATTAYNTTARTVTRQDFRDKTTIKTSDAQGRLISLDTPGGDETYGYDAVGQRTRLTDGRSNVTWDTYNTWNLPESTIEASTTAHPNAVDRTWTTTYNQAGLLTTQVAPGGVSRTTTYDALGRPTGETGSGAEAATTARTWQWDLSGRLTGYGTPAGNATVTYNDRGKPLTVVDPAAGTTTYSYDAHGRVSSRTDATGAALFGYNDKGLIESEYDPVVANELTYQYNAANQPSEIQSGGGEVHEDYTYDDWGRLDTHTVANNGTTMWAADYGYDNNSNVTSEVITPAGVAGSGSDAYTYDDANRLTSWAKSGSPTVNYGWDGADNRTSAGGTTFSYDQRNRLTSSVDGGVTTNYTYTPRGTQRTTKVASGAVQNQTFDAFDRTVTDAGLPGSLTYDSLDRVRSRNGTAINWEGLTQNLTSDGTNTYSYRHDGRPNTATTGGSSKSLYVDRHGDVIGTADHTDTALDGSTAYDPFGVPTTAGTPAGRLGYQGDWTDPDNGRVNMNARQYAPATGRFTSRDSVDDPMANNRYGYAAGNPITNSDTSGHQIDTYQGTPFADQVEAWLKSITSTGGATSVSISASFMWFYFSTTITAAILSAAIPLVVFALATIVFTTVLLVVTQEPAGDPNECANGSCYRFFPQPGGPGADSGESLGNLDRWIKDHPWTGTPGYGPGNPSGPTGRIGPGVKPPEPTFMDRCLADWQCRGTLVTTPREQPKPDPTPGTDEAPSIFVSGQGDERYDVSKAPIPAVDIGISPDPLADERGNTEYATGGSGPKVAPQRATGGAGSRSGGRDDCSATRSTPFGFNSSDGYADFRSDLLTGLASIGFGEASAAFQGSSVTGRSFRTGAPFDVGRLSDFDIALGGADIFGAARDAGVSLRSGGTRTGPLTRAEAERLGLTDLQASLSEKAGRPVNFMVFESIQDALDRSPSIRC